MSNELLENLECLHTTKLGIMRIKRNLGLGDVDVIAWCRLKIQNSEDINRKGKNWYVRTEDFRITINARSFTIITAHKERT